MHASGSQKEVLKVDGHIRRCSGDKFALLGAKEETHSGQTIVGSTFSYK